MHLAPLGAHDRLDVLRPRPAWRVVRPTDGGVVQVDEVEPAQAKDPRLCRMVQALFLQACHGRNSRIARRWPNAPLFGPRSAAAENARQACGDATSCGDFGPR